MDGDIAISIRDISKRFKMYPSPKERLKELLHPFGKRYHRDFWALKDVSFDVGKGETVGIIGRNGCGKSTLLQLICGILRPTSGEVTARGRISALLELGTGFNPEFSGRENVFMQGAVMCVSKAEMEERFDDIAAFADIGDFIEQPVKTYSSGMYVRLAFAVAINVDPDILIVDEALAVGDAMFQRKCFRKLEEFRKAGKTILFVSHALQTVVTLCSRAVLLNDGTVVDMGNPNDIANKYQKLLAEREEKYLGKIGGESKEMKSATNARGDGAFSEFRVGSGDAEIFEAKLINDAEDAITMFEKGQHCTIIFSTRLKKDIREAVTGVAIKNLTGLTIAGRVSAPLRDLREGDIIKSVYRFRNTLNPGIYALTVSVAEELSTHRRNMDTRRDVLTFRVFGDNADSPGLVDMDMEVKNTLSSYSDAE